MKKGPVTPKGFRDIDPKTALKRRNTINEIISVLEKNDFVPLETSTVEFADTLIGNYGEEEKLIYQFEDRGGRQLALRFDLTVPLARYVANNPGVLEKSAKFSTYRVGQVFRGEKPQAGRFREFTQLDFDTVGGGWPDEDAKVIAACLESVRKLGLKKPVMLINDRRNFGDTPVDVIRAFDKLYKIGLEGVQEELRNAGYQAEDVKKFTFMFTQGKEMTALPKLFGILKDKYKLKEEKDFIFSPSLARGLDYYSATIFELKPSSNPAELSVGGGGRYDRLIEKFAGRPINAVGFSFGLDRLVELLH